MKIVTVIGARPQFVKASAVSASIKAYNAGKLREIIVHTGQHYDEMLNDVFFGELRIPDPQYHLNVGSGSHGFQTGEMLQRIEDVLLQEQPDIVLVYGDTNSTLAAALAASKLSMPVAHVEAGLRSFNRAMPEEINRVLTDHIADLHLCPTKTAVTNLSSEGIKDRVHLVGDVMQDVLRKYSAIAKSQSDILLQLKVEPRQYLLATVHRQENTDDSNRLQSIMQGFNEIGASGAVIVFPMHPRTKSRLEKFNISLHENILAIEPVPYFSMLALESQAKMILTDSGGVQKEAYWLGVPCITLRNETEWLETLIDEQNILVGYNTEQIVLNALRRDRVGKLQSAADMQVNASDNIVHLVATYSASKTPIKSAV